MLGIDWKVFDWQDQCKKFIRPTSSLHFKISCCKRIIITRNKYNNVVVQGEPFYKSNIANAQGICKKGKSLSDVNPSEMNVGECNVKPEKNEKCG